MIQAVYTARGGVENPEGYIHHVVRLSDAGLRNQQRMARVSMGWHGKHSRCCSWRWAWLSPVLAIDDPFRGIIVGVDISAFSTRHPVTRP